MVASAKRTIAIGALSLLCLASAWSGSIYDDIRENDLPSLQRKVELLGMSLAKEPYLAFYFRNAKDFRKPLFDFLIENGSDPDMPDIDGVYPIHWAIKNFGAREVEALLEAGANTGYAISGNSLELRDIYSELLGGKGYSDIRLSSRGSIWTPIALSVYFQKPEILALFAEDMDPTTSAWLWTAKDAPKDQLRLIELPFWKSRLGSAGMSGGAARCFSILWKKNMDLPPEQRTQLPTDYEGSLLAVLEDDLPALKRHLARDSESSIKYLPYAIVSSSLECLDFLMKFNDLSAQSIVAAFDLELVHGAPDDAAPLYAYALMNGDLEMLTWFGERGANFNNPFRYACRTSGESLSHNQSGALSAAIRMELGFDVIGYLLSKGADPNIGDSSTPLLLALIANDDELASMLLDAGANPNARVSRKTVMGQAAMTASPEVLRKCIEKKGSVTLSDSYGWTALHYAVTSGDLEKVRLLVEAKASAQARTNGAQRWGSIEIPYGSTPLDLARLIRKSANSDSQQKSFDAIIEYLSGPQKPSTKK